MKNWVIVKTFDRIQQAQFRKSLLEQNNIEAVVFVKKDSAFLLGNIELLVKTENKSKAIQVLNAFKGWTLLLNFIRKKPLEIVEEILQQSEIETMLTEDFDSVLLKKIYSLYVPSPKAKMLESWFINPPEWKLVLECHHINFSAYYFDILNKYQIETIVLSKENESSFKTNYSLYVQTEKYDYAMNLLAELRGWTVIHSPKNKEDAEKWVDFLEGKNIPAIFEQEAINKNYYLYTQLEFENEATIIINENRDWKLAGSFSNIQNAMLSKSLLQQHNIEAIIMTKKDSSFLIGDIELYVDNTKLEEAIQIIKDIGDIEYP